MTSFLPAVKIETWKINKANGEKLVYGDQDFEEVSSNTFNIYMYQVANGMRTDIGIPIKCNETINDMEVQGQLSREEAMAFRLALDD